MERDKLICLDVSKSPNTREPALNTRATQDIKGNLRFLNVILPSQRDMSELQWYSQRFVYDQEFKKNVFSFKISYFQVLGFPFLLFLL